MTRTVEEIMTTDPRTVATTDTVADAARQMRDADIGNVIVVDGEETAGIITDRDIVIRAIAEGRDPESTTVADVCTTGLTTLEPDQSIDEAVQIMRDHDIRRLPVVKDGRPVGVLSLGDLAQEREPESALADISSASPSQ